MSVLVGIDIGSISVRMLVARFENQKLIPLHQALEITKLGKGVSRTNLLDQEAMDRTLKVLKEYQAIADHYGAQKILAVGTSAIRDAKNGPLFSEKIEEETRIELRVLSGKSEARLTFTGAVHGLETSEDVMLIDVGGGSTEIICGSSKKILHECSINAGAVRMTERFIQHDPVEHEEYCKLENTVREMIEEAKVDAAADCQYLVGVGGTVTSLAAIALKLEKYDSSKVNHYCLIKSHLDEIVGKMRAMNNKERKSMRGLQPERADIILAGAVIVKQIMEEFSWNRMIVSESDILDGILLSHLGLVSDSYF